MLKNCKIMHLSHRLPHCAILAFIFYGESVMSLCPCLSGLNYQECCQPLHQGTPADSAEQLMRSRYSAYTLADIDYIVNTTVPSQQKQLNRRHMREWAVTTKWCGLTIIGHIPTLSPRHALVEFKAFFKQANNIAAHHEHSLFVNIDNRWYFVDPTVDLPAPKQPCVCRSGKKFKQCCAPWLLSDHTAS